MVNVAMWTIFGLCVLVSGIIVICNIIKEEKQNKLKKEFYEHKYYIKYNGMRYSYLNLNNYTLYDPETNKYVNFDKNFKRIENSYDNFKLHYKDSIDSYGTYDEESYNKKISLVCNCEVGSGVVPEIVVGKNYEFPILFAEFFGYGYDNIDYKYKKYNRHNINIECAEIYYRDFLIGIIHNINNFHQKACIKCNTCLDEKYDLFQQFEKIKNENEKRLEQVKQVANICESKENNL